MASGGFPAGTARATPGLYEELTSANKLSPVYTAIQEKKIAVKIGLVALLSDRAMRWVDAEGGTDRVVPVFSWDTVGKAVLDAAQTGSPNDTELAAAITSYFVGGERAGSDARYTFRGKLEKEGQGLRGLRLSAGSAQISGATFFLTLTGIMRLFSDDGFVTSLTAHTDAIARIIDSVVPAPSSGDEAELRAIFEGISDATRFRLAKICTGQLMGELTAAQKREVVALVGATHPATAEPALGQIISTVTPLLGRAGTSAEALTAASLRLHELTAMTAKKSGKRGASGGGGDTFPLLDRLREELPEILEGIVLPAVDPTALALLARTGRGWRAAVVSSGLPRAGSAQGLRMKVSAFCGSVELLAWAKASGCPWNDMTCALAAEGGHLDVLRWAREQDCPWDANTCAEAARGGHLEVLRWAREHHCPWNKATCALAAKGGHLDVLRWAREHDCVWDGYTCAIAAKGGHLEVLRWAREHDCPWGTANTCYHAALGGHLDVLRWLREHGCPLGTGMCAGAAKGGHLDMLRWLRELGCPWDTGTCEGAAYGGHLDMLKWAREQHCPWDTKTCERAAEGGHLDVLGWAREHDCPWNKARTCALAAKGGNLDVLRWAREHGCPWDASTFAYAAQGGHLDVLRWMREHGCPWNEFTCTGAAEGGHLDVLRWLRSRGCPWNENTCDHAALGGHLDVLIWAREHHCPWNENTCGWAAKHAPLQVLRWAMDHGAPTYGPGGDYNEGHLEWYEHLLRGEPHASDVWRANLGIFRKR